jgi:flagellar basal-body rod protein FlgF
MDGMTISEISMRNDLLKLETLSHNVSNITTPAYKRTLVSTEAFANQLNQLEVSNNLRNTATSEIIPNILQEIDFTTGSLKHSGNPLDLAIEGDGFFELINDTGTYYSKRGNFSLDSSGKVLLSGTSMGLNGLGGDIRLKDINATIDSLGKVSEDGQQVAQLKIVSFSDMSKLINVGQGVFKVGEGVGLNEVELPAVRQGYIESSNTQPADEMLNLISLARHFEATQQVIRGYDEMLATVFEDLGKF